MGSSMTDLDIDSLIQAATTRVNSERNLMQDLTAAWVLERNSPELRPYEQTLMEAATQGLMDRTNEILEVGEIDMKMNFKLVIVQTEMERLKYLMRSYIRTRISKIDRYTLHYTSDAVDATRLSSLERHYAAKHQAIQERHCVAAFMKDFPDSSAQLRKMDDTGAAGLSMVDKPDMNKAVFCKVTGQNDEIIKIGDDQLELTAGATFLVRYSAIRRSLLDVRNTLCGLK